MFVYFLPKRVNKGVYPFPSTRLIIDLKNFSLKTKKKEWKKNKKEWMNEKGGKKRNN